MSTSKRYEGWQVEAVAVEAAVGDLLALLRATAEATGTDEYDVRIGIDWSGADPLEFLTTDGHDIASSAGPLHHFVPVQTTLNGQASDPEFRRSLYALAEDCINQGGVPDVRLIEAPVTSDAAN